MVKKRRKNVNYLTASFVQIITNSGDKNRSVKTK